MSCCNEISRKGMLNGVSLARKHWETHCMVGREEGLGCKHANATMARRTMSSRSVSVGCGSRWSNTSLNVIPLSLEADWSDDSISLGCFPTKISSATIPKLYTSHFSLTTIVYASSTLIWTSPFALLCCLGLNNAWIDV